MENNSIPVGTIVPYFGDEYTLEDSASSWLICDGRSFKQVTFPALHLHLRRLDPNRPEDTTHNETRWTVPDLRGLFVRGLGERNNETTEPRKLGSVQNDATKKSVTEIQVPAPAKVKGSSKGADGGPNLFVSGTQPVRVDYGDGSETRPVNVALNYIIKALI